MWTFLVLCVVATVGTWTLAEECGTERYIKCMEPVHNATFGHEHGLFQNLNDLADSCPVIREGVQCIRAFATDCGTEQIAENFEDQFEKPARLLTQICNIDSPLRTEYLIVSPCLLENSDDLEVCSTKVQEFLAYFEADTVEKELTVTCIYESMLRACLMSTAAEKCGLQTASFVRKALLYSPSAGLDTCSKQ